MRRFKFRGEINTIQGDITSLKYPDSDLILIYPPYYGFDLIYASLSLPHFTIANMFKKLEGFELTLEKQVKRENFFSSLKTILGRARTL